LYRETHGDKCKKLDTVTCQECAVLNTEEEEQWEPFIPDPPSPIISGFYGKDNNKFWLTMVMLHTYGFLHF